MATAAAHKESGLPSPIMADYPPRLAEVTRGPKQWFWNLVLFVSLFRPRR